MVQIWTLCDGLGGNSVAEHMLCVFEALRREQTQRAEKQICLKLSAP